MREGNSSTIIKKHALTNLLRHSFVTYLLDSKVDLRYTQEILEHKSSETTKIYIYVSKIGITNIKNPFDDILRRKKYDCIQKCRYLQYH